MIELTEEIKSVLSKTIIDGGCGSLIDGLSIYIDVYERIIEKTRVLSIALRHVVCGHSGELNQKEIDSLLIEANVLKCIHDSPTDTIRGFSWWCVGDMKEWDRDLLKSKGLCVPEVNSWPLLATAIILCPSRKALSEIFEISRHPIRETDEAYEYIRHLIDMHDL